MLYASAKVRKLEEVELEFKLSLHEWLLTQNHCVSCIKGAFEFSNERFSVTFIPEKHTILPEILNIYYKEWSPANS